jgi:hypothetical protein
VTRPLAVDEVSEELISVYRRAWDRVNAELQSLQLDPLSMRRRSRLIEMRRSIEAVMEGLDEQAAKWVATRLPEVYALGAHSTGAAAISAEGSAIWTAIQQEAVEELAQNLFGSLLKATSGVNDATKDLINRVAKDEALQKAIEGRTAKQAGREMERLLRKQGLSAVTYANGAEHGLAEYAQMAIRTTTATAYNRAALSDPDVLYYEVFDGLQCGMRTHDDPWKAHGSIVTREQAGLYLISHPNCRRAFGARPDIEDTEQARKASGSTTQEQDDFQLARERGYDKAAPDERASAEPDAPRTITRLEADPATIQRELDLLEMRLKAAPGGGARARIKRQIEVKRAELERATRVDPPDLPVLPDPRIATLEGEIEQLRVKLKAAAGGRARAKVKAEIADRERELSELRRDTKPDPELDPPRPPPPPDPTPPPVEGVGKEIGGKRSSLYTDEELAKQLKAEHKFWTNDKLRNELLGLRLAEIPDAISIRKAHPGWTTKVAERNREKQIADLRARLGFDGGPPPVVKPDPDPDRRVEPKPKPEPDPPPPPPETDSSIYASATIDTRVKAFAEANGAYLERVLGDSLVPIVPADTKQDLYRAFARAKRDNLDLLEKYPALYTPDGRAKEIGSLAEYAEHKRQLARLVAESKADIKANGVGNWGYELRYTRPENAYTNPKGIDAKIRKALQDRVSDPVGADGMERIWGTPDAHSRQLDAKKIDEAIKWYGSMMSKKAAATWQRHDPANTPLAFEPGKLRGTVQLRAKHPVLPMRMKFGSTAASKKRAYYQGRVVYGGNSPTRTVVHEMGHGWENTLGAPSSWSSQGPRSKLQEDAKAFLRYRQGKESASQIYPGRKGLEDEIGVKDDFLEHYMGKYYRNDTELIAMGMELMYAEPARLLFGDPEMFHWIAGILQGEITNGVSSGVVREARLARAGGDAAERAAKAAKAAAEKAAADEATRRAVIAKREARLAAEKAAREAAERAAKEAAAKAAREAAERAARTDGGLAEAYAKGFTSDRTLNGGNVGLEVRIVTLSDGRKAVVKTMSTEAEAAKEIGAANLYEALGGTGFRAERLPDDAGGNPRVVMPFVEGETGGRAMVRFVDEERARLGPQGFYAKYIDPTSRRQGMANINAQKVEEQRQIESENGLQIAILDHVIVNYDRHSGNWMVRGDRVIPIDHGNAQFEAMGAGGLLRTSGSPFADYWLGIKTNRNGDLSQLRPKFNRAQWEPLRDRMLAAIDRDYPVGRPGPVTEDDWGHKLNPDYRKGLLDRIRQIDEKVKK